MLDRSKSPLSREIKREDIREYKFYDIYFNHKDKKSSPCPL
jgi:IS30 family transposase